MATRDRGQPRSAQQVDRSSWFMGPLVPLVFAGIVFIYGVILISRTWRPGDPLTQPVALALCTGSLVLAHFATRPLRRAIGWRTGSVILAFAVAGMVLSAWGYSSAELTLELWWGPLALALAIASLAPYLPTRTLLSLGSVATVVAGVPSALFLAAFARDWGPLGVVVLTVYPPILGTATVVTFSWAVVRSTLAAVRDLPEESAAEYGSVPSDAEVERVLIDHFAAQAVPFLTSIADAANITPADRTLAGELARQLRDDLVAQSSLTWLDSIADPERLVVADPDQLAGCLNDEQRTALRALLRGYLSSGSETVTALIALKSRADGSIAVTVSAGRSVNDRAQLAQLAPYYLALDATVDDLRFEGRPRVQLSFRIPTPTDPS